MSNQVLNALTAQANALKAAVVAAKGNKAWADLNSIRKDHPTAGQIYDSFMGHAKKLEDACSNLTDRDVPLILSYYGNAEDSLKAATLQATALQHKALAGPQLVLLGDFGTNINAVFSNIRAARDLVGTLDQTFSAIQRGIKTDAQTMRSTFDSDHKTYVALEARMRKFHKDHSGAKYICKELGKGMISMGGWALADGVGAYNAAKKLKTEGDSLWTELNSLKSLGAPLDQLTNSLQALVLQTGSVVTQAEQVDTVAQHVTDEAKLIGSDIANRAMLHADTSILQTTATRIKKAIERLASRDPVRGILTFNPEGFGGHDVLDSTLRSELPPGANLDEFRYWALAVARYGAKQVNSDGENYILGIPNFETGRLNGQPSRGVALVPKDPKILHLMVAKSTLAACISPNLSETQLMEPRYWASAINRFAMRHVGPGGQKYGYGLPDWEEGFDNNHNPALGAFLFPPSIHVRWQDVPEGALLATFSPALSVTQLNEPRYWASASNRYGLRTGQGKVGCAVPTWEVGAHTL